jgi:hypothetical protein
MSFIHDLLFALPASRLFPLWEPSNGWVQVCRKARFGKSAVWFDEGKGNGEQEGRDGVRNLIRSDFPISFQHPDGSAIEDRQPRHFGKATRLEELQHR